jgi:hypothetical protein
MHVVHLAPLDLAVAEMNRQLAVPNTVPEQGEDLIDELLNFLHRAAHQ